MSKLVIQAGDQLDDWGTPAEVLEFVRAAFGQREISLDLASNATANKLVRAKRFYSLEAPCPDNPQVRGGIVWCNPPGPVEEVRRFWNIWRRAVCNPKAWGGAFLIFNLDHWRTLDRPFLSEVFSVVIWPKRLQFVGAPSQYNHPSGLVFAGEYTLASCTANVVRWSK